MVVDWLWVRRGDFKALHEKLERWWSLKRDRKWKEEQVCWETNMLPKSSNTEAGTQASTPGSHGSSVRQVGGPLYNYVFNKNT